MAASHQSAWAVPDGIHCPDLEELSPPGAYFVEVPDILKSVSFIEKDSKRFPDTSGWGYAQFYMMQRLIRSSLSGATVHSGRKFVTSAIRL